VRRRTTPPPEGHVTLATELLDAGADMRAADASRFTPLHCVASAASGEAVSEGALELLATLLCAHGGDVAAVTARGNTPLHLAAQVRCARELSWHHGSSAAQTFVGESLCLPLRRWRGRGKQSEESAPLGNERE
jgi:hypothetical protein